MSLHHSTETPLPSQGRTQTRTQERVRQAPRQTRPAAAAGRPAPRTSRTDRISLSTEGRRPQRSNAPSHLVGALQGTLGEAGVGPRANAALGVGGAVGPGVFVGAHASGTIAAARNSGQRPASPSTGDSEAYRATQLPISHDTGGDRNGWHTQQVNGHPEQNPVILERDVQELNGIGREFRRLRHDNLEISSGERDSLHTARTFLGQRPEHQAELYHDQPYFRDYQRQLQSIPGWEPPRDGESERAYGQRMSHLLPEFNRRVAALMQQPDGERVGRFISNHQSGNSFDISLRGSHMGFTDIREARRLFEARGYRVTEETDHLHIDRPGDHEVTTSARPTISAQDRAYRYLNEAADQNRDTIAPRLETATRLGLPLT